MDEENLEVNDRLMDDEILYLQKKTYYVGLSERRLNFVMLNLFALHAWLQHKCGCMQSKSEHLWHVVCS